MPTLAKDDVQALGGDAANHRKGASLGKDDRVKFPKLQILLNFSVLHIIRPLSNHFRRCYS